jgi:hypothetical protein
MQACTPPARERAVLEHLLSSSGANGQLERTSVRREHAVAHGDVPSSDAVRCPNIRDRPGVRAMWTSAGQSE